VKVEDLNEIQKAKLAVLQNAFGLCSLSGPEFYEALEKIYWLGFKAGHEMCARDEAIKKYKTDDIDPIDLEIFL
jgi:hypothetical protein